ncbi:hypothetical protein ATK17_1147 [Branchiibius hedensis]|uniref:Uncharacterized protein n=1 Tax=Branchiibius hedensis TaxID=672460 RepID=A0A2Y8ZNF8_9MICO|nr:amidohydrolase [Branchiibius hedensis]PWJ25035.1 hypothetical protein ATK17_1147 [Branchiibius hedensis]SSA33850.1 hypothetical protein SAMN04489750_1147 [Branchiibius hedensis]
MDRILTANTVITMDPRLPRAEAVAVSDDRIVAVGTLAACQAALPQADLVDTKAAALMPGFIDAHSHPVVTGPGVMPPNYWIAPWFAPKWDDVLAMFQKAIDETPPGSPLAFSGFDALLHEHDAPDAASLDAIFGDRMVFVQDNSGHAGYVTTAVLKKLGFIDNPPKDPVGGSFERNPDGSLNGRAHEVPAIEVFAQPVADVLLSQGNPLQGAVEYYLYFAAAGITSTSEHTYRASVKSAYEALAKLPSCPLRISLYHMSTEPDAGDPFTSDVPENMLRKIGVKLWADGSPWIGNVAMSTPYLDTPTTHAAGIVPGLHGEEQMNYSRAQLDSLLDQYAPQGWQMSFHANGDVAADIVLDAFSRALDKHDLSGTDHRWRIEHIGGARKDQFPRMAQIGVVPSLGPFQFSYWGDLLDGKMFASEVGSQWQRARDAFDAGLKVSFHNDGSVSPPMPLRSVQSMVTRRTVSGQLHGAEQAISVDEGLRAITINAAYSLRHEDQVGSIEVGKLADFVLLGADPYAVPVDTIEKIEVLGTWVGGSPIDMDEFASAGEGLPKTDIDQMIALGVPLCQH